MLGCAFHGLEKADEPELHRTPTLVTPLLTIDRAVLKDMEEAAKPLKLTDCSPATLQAICHPKKLEECERQCREALDEEEW